MPYMQDDEEMEQDFFRRQAQYQRSQYQNSERWKVKALRFARYLSTRQIECWGFFAAGFLLAKIF